MNPKPRPISMEIEESQLIEVINKMTKLRRARVISTLATYLANDLTKDISKERAALIDEEVEHNDPTGNDWYDVGGDPTPAEELAIALYRVGYPAHHYRTTKLRELSKKQTSV
jgi:hypothetical protein